MTEKCLHNYKVHILQQLFHTSSLKTLPIPFIANVSPATYNEQMTHHLFQKIQHPAMYCSHTQTTRRHAKEYKVLIHEYKPHIFRTTHSKQ
jgi:hypothetical protein